MPDKAGLKERGRQMKFRIKEGNPAEKQNKRVYFLLKEARGDLLQLDSAEQKCLNKKGKSE